jgi:hypothetical protein
MMSPKPKPKRKPTLINIPLQAVPPTRKMKPAGWELNVGYKSPRHDPFAG